MSKDVTVQVRVTARMLRDWQRAAKRDDVSLSEWIRQRCRLFKPGRTYALRDGAGSYRIRWSRR